MPSAQFVTTGDLHFGSLGHLFGDHGDDLIYQCIQNPIDYAIENGVAHVIVPGDIFDGANPKQSTQVRLFEWFREYPDLTFWCIGGNHEKHSADDSGLDVFDWVESVRALPNVRLFSRPAKTSIDGVPFVFLPHPYYYWPRPMHGEAVHVGHFDLAGARGDNGHTLRSGVKLSEIRDRGHVYVIGHLHTYQRLTPRIVFCGTTFQKTFGESMPKGFIHGHVEWESGRFSEVKLDYNPIRPAFELVTLQIEQQDDLNKLTRDPGVFYSVHLMNDVAVPDDLFDRFPNILKHSRFRDLAELTSINAEDLQSISVDIEAMIETDLDQFLTRREWDDEKKGRAKVILREVLKDAKQLGTLPE